MPKRSSKKPADDQAGRQEAQPTPDVEPEVGGGKDPAAVSLGRRGGKKGGPARAAKLSKEQRSEIARKAAQARWAKRKT